MNCFTLKSSSACTTFETARSSTLDVDKHTCRVSQDHHLCPSLSFNKSIEFVDLSSATARHVEICHVSWMSRGISYPQVLCRDALVARATDAADAARFPGPFLLLRSWCRRSARALPFGSPQKEMLGMTYQAQLGRCRSFCRDQNASGI